MLRSVRIRLKLIGLRAYLAERGKELRPIAAGQFFVVTPVKVEVGIQPIRVRSIDKERGEWMGVFYTDPEGLSGLWLLLKDDYQGSAHCAFLEGDRTYIVAMGHLKLVTPRRLKC